MPVEPTPDPMRELRMTITPVAPRPEFTAGLRRRLEAELARAEQIIDVPEEEHHHVHVSDVHHRDHQRDGTECRRLRRPSSLIRTSAPPARAMRSPSTPPPSAPSSRCGWSATTGAVGHAEFTIGDTVFYIADEHPEYDVLSPSTLGGSAVRLELLVDDVDAWYERAVAAGAIGERPPSDQFHGNRNASLRDPFGHRWSITHPVEQLTAVDYPPAARQYHTTYAPGYLGRRCSDRGRLLHARHTQTSTAPGLLRRTLRMERRSGEGQPDRSPLPAREQRRAADGPARRPR